MTVRRVVVGAALLVCALLACANAAPAQQLPEASAQLDEDGRWVNGVTESWWQDEGITKADATSAAARWKKIGDEVAVAGAEGWAGDYFRGGETHGTYLRWSPHGGFVIASVDKCRAAVMGVIYGRVEATPTLVQFFPELYKVPAHKHGDHDQQEQQAATPPAVIRYVPIEWRGERLLVAEQEMEDFGDYVAGLGEYNGVDSYFFLGYATFFSRMKVSEANDADANDSVMDESHAPPVVPPGYERFMKKPVEAVVTSVGNRRLKRDYLIEGPHAARQFDRASLTSVNISAGTAQGVKDGMLFHVSEPDEGDIIMVVRAGENESKAVVVRELNERGAELYYDEETREKKHSKVVAGWRLTTLPF